MPNWRLAASLKALRAQIDAQFPNRSKVSDGSIGDTRHSARKSDHNPNGKGVVCAIDITHDPDGGVDCQQLAQALVTNRDPRLKYVIWNSKIASGNHGWRWRDYTGANAHKHHLHVSVVPDENHYDQHSEWNLGFAPAKGGASGSIDGDGGELKHSVVAGNTLSGLAKTYGTTVAKLREWNNLDSDLIRVGQVLRVK